jgi:hypothetical protein
MPIVQIQLTSQTILLDVKDSDTISSIKTKIMRQHGIPRQCLTLMRIHFEQEEEEEEPARKRQRKLK